MKATPARLSWPTRPWLRRVLVCAAAFAAIALLLLVRHVSTTAPLERLSATPGQLPATTRWHGSLYLPRGGPYVLGFDSPAGPASLTIDGRRVLAGSGQKSARVVYPAGIAAIDFQAPAGARLLWHPPGRRGPLEYLPASALSSESPEHAHFGAFAGASPMDGVIAALIVLILIALAVYLAAPLFPRIDKQTALWVCAVAAVALAIRLYDLGAAGQTWDEDVNWSAGRNYITNWLSLDFADSSWTWNQEHPPVMKYLAGIGAQFADGYGPARALSALMVALGCALLVPIGRRLAGLRLAVLAGFLAALSPHLIAHGKIVGHEAPTVFLWALAIWLALMAHDPAPNPADDTRPAHALAAQPSPAPWSGWLADPLFWRMLVIGVVLGLAVFSRFVNLLLAPLLGAILLVQAPKGRRLRTVLMGCAVIAPVALLVGVAIWPRLWSEPIAHMQEAWAKLRKPHSPEPFLGIIDNQPPRYYFALYLMATAPLAMLLASFAWVARALARPAELRTTLVLLAWLLIPMIVMFSPVRQDGVRYIMPCLLALALTSAMGAEFLLGQLARITRLRPICSRARAFVILGLIFCGYLAVCAVRIHPYYLDYYGEHAGGPAGVAANKRFEVAWWGEGIGEAIAYINRHAQPGARVHKQCVEPSHLTWLRADLWAPLARRVEEADWIMVYQPSWRRCPVPGDAHLMLEVRAAGAPLVRVYRRGP
jgi:4-amino-4-deoxy-L-arabinose transferase-like glycosyltransferase